jgi:hypothetical protein
LRCIQECDCRANCRARDKPNQSIRILLRHAPILAVLFDHSGGRGILVNMESQVVVFRSADETASEDVEKVREMLLEQGVPAEVADDTAPGVPSGALEVRVAAADQERAEQLIARFNPEDEFANVDPSEDLDEVTVFQSAGGSSEMEAASVQALLEAGGISASVVDDARFPNLGQEVRVAQEHVNTAKQLIADALAAGPAGAEEAEASGEAASKLD